jgi:hypothetical protein
MLMERLRGTSVQNEKLLLLQEGERLEEGVTTGPWGQFQCPANLTPDQIVEMKNKLY